MSKKCIVLCSGGLDSTTCLALAVNKFRAENVVSVSLNYGQKHSKELKSAQQIARKLGVWYMEVNIKNLFLSCKTGLFKQDTINTTDAKATEVPFRNGLFASLCTTLAMSYFPGEAVWVYMGILKTDYQYKDCKATFLAPLREAIKVGSGGKVHFETPFLGKTKAEMLKVGNKLNAPYELTWSCYNGGKKPCGKCKACVERAEAFKELGEGDPANE